jgi:hypothetical protein
MPIWYSFDGEVVRFFTGTQGRAARKTALIERAGAVTLTVQQDSFPYRYVTVEGRVSDVERPPRREHMLGVVERYLPPEVAGGFVDSEIGQATGALVLFSVTPERWYSLDFSQDAG